MSAFLQTAIKAAQAAGEIQRKFYGKPLQVEVKDGNTLNLVTQIDRQCEKTVFSVLRKKFPSHGLWGEESGGAPKKKGYTWVVDPLDGTTNYTHRYPFFCCSVALLKDGRPVAAAVYEPLRRELFAAEKDGGATLNGKPIRVSAVPALSHSLLCTGFAYQVHQTGYNLENFKRFILKSQGVRRDGSAALNLCYVACGRFEGFWERGIQAWDMAAGVLIAKEAGAVVTDLSGGPYDLLAQNVLASNAFVHKAMQSILADSPDEKKYLGGKDVSEADPILVPLTEMELPLFNNKKPTRKKSRG
jgi:myo-inositol-1(or 4)-monophosphatase